MNIRSFKLIVSTIILGAALGGAMSGAAQTTNVYIDPTQNWVGYMNWWPSPYTVANFPGDGGTAGSIWGTGALQAFLTPGGVVTLLPCTNVYDSTSDPYWVNPDGTGANTMDANFYVENSSLAGDTVTFSGYLWENTFVAPYNTNCTAFIKDFNPYYTLVGSVATNLTNVGFWSITLATTAGDNIQYGFETQGPDANPATVASLGEAVVASTAPPAGPAITFISSSTSAILGSSVSIIVTATGNSLSYQWQQNGVNLTNGSAVSGARSATLTLNSVTGSSEGNYTVVVTDNLNRTASGSTYVVVLNPGNLSFDPNAPLNGYINAYGILDGEPDGYETGFAYPTALLPAGITNGVATLQPNTTLWDINNPFWTNPDGSPNAYVEEDWFIANDALAGSTLTFNGYCLANNLDPSYIASVWIEDFAPDYSSFTSANSNLVAGVPFSITLATTAGDHIQYGLRLDGPDNAPTNPITQRSVLVSVAPLTITATRASGTTTVSFATVSGHTYTVQYKNHLTDAAWQTLTTVNGSGASQSVNDTTSQTARFYRVSVD